MKKRKPVDGHTKTNRLLQQARRDFERHEHKEIGPGHWVIRRKHRDGRGWDSAFFTHIVVMGRSAISVWGDISACVFAYCSGAITPEAVIAWMGRRPDPHYYGRQKAHIGMGAHELLDSFDDAVALFDLRWQRRQLALDISGSHPQDEKTGRFVKLDTVLSERCRDAFDDAERKLGSGEHPQLIKQALYDDLSKEYPECYEWVFDIGSYTSSRVVYALAAIERLHILLAAEGGERAEAA